MEEDLSAIAAEVEYSLTEIGWSLMPIIDAMNQWRDSNREFLETVVTQNLKSNQISKSTCNVYRPIIAKGVYDRRIIECSYNLSQQMNYLIFLILLVSFPGLI